MMYNIVMPQQSLRLSFIGQIGDGGYQKMDYIEIRNVTRDWFEVLYYPDTILVINPSVNVNDKENNEHIRIAPSIFQGETNINITVEQPSNVVITAYGIRGNICSRYESTMNIGNHSFKLYLNKPQLYILSVQIGDVCHTMKVCNIGQGSSDCIVLANSSSFIGQTLDRGDVTHYFEYGDIMDFVGYATINGSVVNSEHLTQSQFFDEDITLHFPASVPTAPQGAINGVFSVSENCQVFFSQGNLQYTKSTQTWSFMDHQYDRVEMPNLDVGEDYANQDVVSLFCWATSGYHNVYDNFNMFYEPNSTAYGPLINPECNYTGYGPSTNMSDPNLTGISAEYDWGVHNAISNGGNQAGLWRALTKEEWKYVLEIRPASTIHGMPNARYAKATVNGVPGVVLFPDVFSVPEYLPYPLAINYPEAGFNFNNYSIEAWTAMENLGCVFLPIAYCRQSNRVHDECYWKQVNRYRENGYYWSSTHVDCADAYTVRFSTDRIVSDNRVIRSSGCSVRLVYTIE